MLFFNTGTGEDTTAIIGSQVFLFIQNLFLGFNPIIQTKFIICIISIMRYIIMQINYANATNLFGGKMSISEKSIFEKISLFSIILLLSNVIFFFSGALAERATIAEMDNVCQNWLLLNADLDQSWRGIDNPKITSIDNIEENGLLIGRIYNLSPDGFVVVPALKEMPPIMTYSDKYALGIEQDQGMRALIEEVISSRMNNFVEAYGDIDAILPINRGELLPGQKFRDLWDRYALDQKDFIAELKSGSFVERSESVGPLLTTSWHQGYPYNMFCPSGYGGQRCVVGCTATAAAQILYYWQWPSEGRDSYSYYWGGDNSCDTSTTGIGLSADFSDPYIYDTTPENLAELSYEVGIAYRMDYGVCGSGAYMEPGVSVLPQYFKYKPLISKRTRSSYASADDWYYSIKEEIDAGRPMHYGISRHSIVCDGYRELGGIKYYHMNYGWGGSMNSWFAIDDVYCSWDGCNYLSEFYIFNIEPCWVWPSSDATFGAVPFEVNLTTETEYAVDNWSWDFGDGNTVSGDYATAQHTYNSPGTYNIKVDIESDGEIYSATRPKYIIVVADTISAGIGFGEIGDIVEIPIFGNNTIPVSKIIMPVSYSGGIGLRYDSCSAVGCRTEDLLLSGGSIGSGFLKFEFMENGAFLEPGSGLLLKAYFTVLSGTATQTATISTNNIGSIYPLFKNNNSGLEYNPASNSGSVYFREVYGDTNCDDAINILDVIQIINYIYKQGPAAIPPHVANINGDAVINILDVIYLINYIYKDGPDPITM